MMFYLFFCLLVIVIKMYFVNEKEGKERQRARVQTFRENIAFFIYVHRKINRQEKNIYSLLSGS